MPPVKSSAVLWVDHDAAADTLDIRYAGGDRYRYFGVPAAIYEELLAAPSIGAFVNDRIKPAYRFEIEPRRRRSRPA